jgi:hypothetical protein
MLAIISEDWSRTTVAAGARYKPKAAVKRALVLNWAAVRSGTHDLATEGPVLNQTFSACHFRRSCFCCCHSAASAFLCHDESFWLWCFDL